MIMGKLVGLTAVEKSDIMRLMEWRNREDFRKYFREYRELNSNMQEKWFEEKVLNDPSTIMFAIKDLKTGKLIGCCGLIYINWIHRHAELSLYIGLDAMYIDDKGYALEAYNLMLKYGFNELGMHKLWSEIYEFDNSKKALYENMGFRLDARLRDHQYYDGKWWNSLVYSMIADEFRQI